jgi:hypothetical protein
MHSRVYVAVSIQYGNKTERLEPLASNRTHWTFLSLVLWIVQDRNNEITLTAPTGRGFDT